MNRLELEVAIEHRVPENALMTMAAYIYQHTVLPPKDPAHEDRMLACSLRRLDAYNQAQGFERSRPQMLRLLILASKDAREACDEVNVVLQIPPRFQDLDEDVWQYLEPYFTN